MRTAAGLAKTEENCTQQELRMAGHCPINGRDFGADQLVVMCWAGLGSKARAWAWLWWPWAWPGLVWAWAWACTQGSSVQHSNSTATYCVVSLLQLYDENEWGACFLDVSKA